MEMGYGVTCFAYTIFCIPSEVDDVPFHFSSFFYTVKILYGNGVWWWHSVDRTNLQPLYGCIYKGTLLLSWHKTLKKKSWKLSYLLHFGIKVFNIFFLNKIFMQKKNLQNKIFQNEKFKMALDFLKISTYIL